MLFRSATTFNGTIPQALMMFNGEIIQRATSVERGSFLWDIASSKLTPKQQIDLLFMSGLARSPNKDEIEVTNKLLVARAMEQAGNGRDKQRVDPVMAQVAALQDIWWAVLNSNEFIINH